VILVAPVLQHFDDVTLALLVLVFLGLQGLLDLQLPFVVQPNILITDLISLRQFEVVSEVLCADELPAEDDLLLNFGEFLLELNVLLVVVVGSQS
jgi:hypothetical protein